MLYHNIKKVELLHLSSKRHLQNKKDKKSQASLEYISVYGWSLLIVAGVLAFLLIYVNLPTTISPSSCRFSDGFYCNAVVLSTNTIAGNMVVMMAITNKQQYAIVNPELIIHVNNKNYTNTNSCFPNYVVSGGSIICNLTLPINAKLGQYFANNVYIKADYCGLTINNCTNPPPLVYVGNIRSHASFSVPPKITFTLTAKNLTNPSRFNVKDPLYATVKLSGYPLRSATVNFSVSPAKYTTEPKITATSISGVSTSYVFGSIPGKAVITAHYAGYTASATVTFVYIPITTTSTTSTSSTSTSSTSSTSTSSTSSTSTSSTSSTSTSSTSSTSTSSTSTTIPPLIISLSPTSATLDVGQSIKLTAHPSGGSGSYHYQWYTSTGIINGATSKTNTFSFKSFTGNSHTFYVYVKITDSASTTATSSKAAIKVYKAISASISPVTFKIDSGQTVKLTSTVKGGSGSYHYQWYKNGTSISGAISDSYTAAPTTRTGATAGQSTTSTYYVTISDSKVSPAAIPATVKSSESSIIVYPSFSVIIKPRTEDVRLGTEVIFDSCILGGSGSIQSHWQCPSGRGSGNSNYNYQWYAGWPTASNLISGATIWWWWTHVWTSQTYGVIVTDTGVTTPERVACSSTIYVYIATLGKKATNYCKHILPLSVSVTPSSIKTYQSITLTAHPENGVGSYTYQWYNLTNGGHVAVGPNSYQFTINPYTYGTFKYDVKVTDSFLNHSTSNAATYVVVSRPPAESNPPASTATATPVTCSPFGNIGPSGGIFFVCDFQLTS